MNEEVKIRNYETLNERRKGLRSALVLFNYLTERRDVFNRIERSKIEIAKDLKVSPRTVGNWLHALANVGALKYKYSGSTRLNPKIYYVGTYAEYVATVNYYESFKSDI